jgi:hypothetical protein
VSAEPQRFFRPPTSASGTLSNLVRVFLDLSGDDEVDWGEIAAIIEQAYRFVAPKEIVAQPEAMRARSPYQAHDEAVRKLRPVIATPGAQKRRLDGAREPPVTTGL